jgi:NAD(P)-dependent dehydrogenase (short-subunit alcohol dehydrogenase family)
MSHSPLMPLAGRVALATGGGSGIGRAAAIRYAKSGAKVVVAGRRTAEFDETVRQISATGGEAIAVPTDVTTEEQAQAVTPRLSAVLASSRCRLQQRRHGRQALAVKADCRAGSLSKTLCRYDSSFLNSHSENSHPAAVLDFMVASGCLFSSRANP